MVSRRNVFPDVENGQMEVMPATEKRNPSRWSPHRTIHPGQFSPDGKYIASPPTLPASRRSICSRFHRPRDKSKFPKWRCSPLAARREELFFVSPKAT